MERKGKIMKKEYAPLLKTVEYMYEKQDPRMHVAFSRDEEEGNYKAIVHCGKCGHLHRIKTCDTRHNKIWRYGKLIGRQFKCPECGCIGITYKEYDWYEPYMAKIFYMTDGSMAISFMIFMNTLLTTKQDIPIYRRRLIRSRLIYSANGQTYYKSPVFVDTGRSPKNFPKKFFNNTYHYSMPTFNSMLKELRDKGIVEKNQHLINRFRKVERYRESVFEFGQMVASSKHYIDKHIVNTLSYIKKETTDEEIYNTMLRRCKIKNGGKKFRRLFAENPIYAYLVSRVFHNVGFKDINSYYKIYDSYKSYRMKDFIEIMRFCLHRDGHNKEIMSTMFKASNENNVANICANKKYMVLFYDIAMYIGYLTRDLHEEDVLKYVSGNIHRTHDTLQEWYNKDCMRRSMFYKARYILEHHAVLNSGKIENKDSIALIKRRSIDRIEELINNKIKYGEKERKLETTINGIRFILPPSTDYLLAAGGRLHNCVGTCYRMRAFRKQCIIVLMKDGSNLVGCIEISNGRIYQAFGPCNKSMNPEAEEAYKIWLKQNNLHEDKENNDYIEFNYARNYVPDVADYDKRIQELIDLTGEEVPEPTEDMFMSVLDVINHTGAQQACQQTVRRAVPF